MLNTKIVKCFLGFPIIYIGFFTALIVLEEV